MFRKLLQGYRRSASASVDYHQPWDGFVPPCTLTTHNNCQYFPVQTANIKVQDIYTGIEVEGDDWMRMACDAANHVG